MSENGICPKNKNGPKPVFSSFCPMKSPQSHITLFTVICPFQQSTANIKQIMNLLLHVSTKNKKCTTLRKSLQICTKLNMHKQIPANMHKQAHRRPDAAVGELAVGDQGGEREIYFKSRH